MNLIFRMLYVFVASYFKSRLPAGRSNNCLNMIVLPNDLDINLHMTNGRYLTICDLNRIDLFIRTGLAKKMVKNGWAPIISEHTMNYKKSLKLFQRYQVSMELKEWDQKYFYMTHLFKCNDRIIAEGTSVGVIRGKQGVVSPQDVIEALSS
jgi:acyl-CoA thioesterase FadM